LRRQHLEIFRITPGERDHLSDMGIMVSPGAERAKAARPDQADSQGRLGKGKRVGHGEIYPLRRER